MPAPPLPLIAERLAELYPTEPDTRRLLAWARVPAARIHFTGSAITTWHSAVVEAHHQGRLLALVEVALEEYPLDEWLHAAHMQMHKSRP